MSSPYQCPVHAVTLVSRVLAVKTRETNTGHRINLPATKTVRYFTCPVTGCTFKKPDKVGQEKTL